MNHINAQKRCGNNLEISISILAPPNQQLELLCNLSVDDHKAKLRTLFSFIYY